MNQREVYRQLNKILPDLILEHEYFSSEENSEYNYLFKNLRKYRRAIKLLDKTGAAPISDTVRKNIAPIMDIMDDQKGFLFTPGRSIEIASITVYDAVSGIIKYLENQFLDDLDENTIDIKLVKIDDLDELEKIANLLKRSFSVPAYELGGKITVNSLEKGSVWIVLGVIAATNMVMKMCANLIWSAAVIQRKFQEVKVAEEHARTVKLKNDFIDILVNHNKSYIEEARRNEANAIANEFLPNRNNELIQHINMSIESIGTLIEKGAQFYPSIKASDEVKALFPDLDLINLIESKTKLLEGNKEGDK